MRHLLVICLFLFLHQQAWSQSVQQKLVKAQKAYTDGDLALASSLAKEGMSQATPKIGAEYRSFVDVLIESKIGANELDEATLIANNYIKVLSDAYGKEDTSLVSYIAVLATVYYLNGYDQEAILAFEQCAILLKNKNLSNSAEYAEIQNNIGMLYSQTGELAKAIEALELSRVFFEKDQVRYKAELAVLYNNMADVFHNKYDYEKADAYYKKTFAVYKTLDDEKSGDYINTMANYSLLLLDRGESNLAIKNLLKNKDNAEQALGKDSPEYATALNNLGQAYKRVGNYRLAEDYLLQAYAVKKGIYEKEHPSRMTAGNNLAMFYFAIGQFDRAELMLEELLEIHNAFHADDLQQLLLYTNNLSAVYYAQGNIKKAQQKAQEVLKLVEKTKGQNSVDYFEALDGYSAMLLEDDKSLEAAFQNYTKLTSLYGSSDMQLPVDDLIAFHNNKGSAAMYTNRHADAVKAFTEGMKLVEEQYGKHHPDYFLFKSNLAYDLTLQGKTQEAAQPLLESVQYKLSQVVDLFPALTESEKEFYNQTLRSDLGHYYTFCIKNFQQYPALIGEMANLRIQSKSLVMRSLNESAQKIINSKNATLIAEYNQLLEHKKEVAKFTSLSKRDLNNLGVNLESEIQKSELLEKQLAKNSEYLGVKPSIKSWKAIAADLKPNEAAIEVIKVYDDFYAKTKVLFYAFLIIKNGQAMPELVVINNGRELEGKQFKYYRNCIGFKMENLTSYATYWAELDKHLQGVGKVYFSADGIYHKINLNTLYHPETKKYLLDEINIELKGSLGQPIGAVKKSAYDAVLVGHPNYYLDLKEALDNISQGHEPNARTLSTDAVVWGDLPGTKKEVENIYAVLQKEGWKVSMHTEENALENKVKNVVRPSILHLATHGFFEEVEQDTLSKYSSEYFTDPMLRSGLALSGAGVDFSPHELSNISFFEDGILYANEALTLNLYGTDCVVMSACETGLGEIRNQEGVYGLQRAFLIAGANAVIMSLWSVNDEATKDLMIAFYNYYGKSKALDSSFRQAMTDIQLKYKEPYYWGAFVLMKK